MRGTATGLMDSNGRPILVGDYVRIPTDVNQEFHGAWAEYEVVMQGLIPVLYYRRSEAGELLPQGYLAQELSGLYDLKLLLYARDVSTLRPRDNCTSFRPPRRSDSVESQGA